MVLDPVQQEECMALVVGKVRRVLAIQVNIDLV